MRFYPENVGNWSSSPQDESELILHFFFDCVRRCASPLLAGQVGLPADQNQYIHRLGRTARAGKGGSGLLLLTEAEQGFVREVGCWPKFGLLSVLRFTLLFCPAM